MIRVLIIITLLTPYFLNAQEKCATNEINANKIQLDLKQNFELWIKDKVQEKKQLQSQFRSHAIAQQIYKVPVVFHVIHNGSAVGEGSNLSDEKIIEQLAIINEDFRRLNSDTTNTPEAFKSIAIDTQIEFVLAKRDPEGIPTTGIVRKQGKSVYSRSDDSELKSLSFWPPDDYFNIYVTNLSSGNLGYAQYPFSNLDGVASELDDDYANTDGVVLDYNWVGINTETGGSFDSFGRTATHEIGHFLGLRHIWGDSQSCSVDDFCEDTPSQSKSTNGCDITTECGSVNMIQNYMDYTNDNCMNLFTQCQKERMRIVLENSPRRKSLRVSMALQEPIVVGNDLGIRSIIDPIISSCKSDVIPRIEVRNYGTNIISSYQVRMYLNGNPIESISMFPDIFSYSTEVIVFDTLILPGNVQNELEFRVISVNGVNDENAENNNMSLLLQPFESQLLPYSTNFETPPSVFRTTENGLGSQWLFDVATDSFATNEAAILPFYNQPNNFGIQDYLLTKVLDLSATNSAQISFKYAYAARSISDSSFTAHHDGLIVAVSTNCGSDFLPQDYLFESYGVDLATVGVRYDSVFVTSSYDDWEEVALNLTNYTGYENLQIAFIGVNGSGNNIYLDDISITSAGLLAYDLGLRKITKMPVVSCDPSINTSIEVKNFGYQKINTLALTVNINGVQKFFTYDNLNLLSGFTKTLSVDLSEDLSDGDNSFDFQIATINGNLDEQTSNNVLSYSVMINQEDESIPVREDMESAFGWTNTSPSGSSLFQIEELPDSTGTNHVLVARAFDTEIAGAESYLVSKNIITHKYTNAAIRFKYSYANRIGYNDNLKVLLSTSCGKIYDKELFNLNAEQLASTTSDAEWEPQNFTDWRTAFIDISEYLIFDKLRIALVFTDGSGNNLYIDDIEVLTTNNPEVPQFTNKLTLYPNPAKEKFILAMNLAEKQTVRIQVISLSGQLVMDRDFPNTLNQEYELFAPTQSGMYILRVIGKDFTESKRLYIHR